MLNLDYETNTNFMSRRISDEKKQMSPQMKQQALLFKEFLNKKQSKSPQAVAVITSTSKQLAGAMFKQIQMQQSGLISRQTAVKSPLEHAKMLLKNSLKTGAAEIKSRNSKISP